MDIERLNIYDFKVTLDDEQLKLLIKQADRNDTELEDILDDVIEWGFDRLPIFLPELDF